MGYSVFVKCRDVRQRDKMANFLDKYFYPNPRDFPGMSAPTVDPCYCGRTRKPLVGIDYNGHLEFLFAWRLCAWMARMLRLRSFCYDGEEDIKLAELGADSIGWWPITGPLLYGEKFYHEKAFQIHRELLRLTELWRNGNGKQEAQTVANS